MINWKIRLKNPLFIAQIALSVAWPVFAYTGLTAQDVTTWSKLLKIVLSALSNPYVLGLVIMSVYNATTDPTTRGFSDSKRALSYDEPSGNGLK